MGNTPPRTGRETKVITDLLLCPTNFLYEEYRGVFGDEIAGALYSALYRADRRPSALRQIVPVDTTTGPRATKHVFELGDHRQIETVCIKRRTGVTICLSTQVGCSVRCPFCQSGRKGLLRNLTASEIVQQYLFVEEKVNRIVFMGIGEPLNNYDELLKAIHIIRDRRGIGFPTDGMTISTVGPVHELRRLRNEHLKIQLVLSLHATDQRTRDMMVPGMSRYSVNETVHEAMAYTRRHNRKLTIAYLLLPGWNDSHDDKERLAGWFGNKNVRVNLMTYNGPVSKAFRLATRDQVARFKMELEKSMVEVSVRRSFGGAIHAACGQLTAM